MPIPLRSITPWRADREHPSPNQSAYPQATNAISGVVLHGTADQGPKSEEGSLSWMSNPNAPGKPSAHLMIHRSGLVTRLVPDTRRAYHAGTSVWRDGRSHCNNFTLGWEFSNMEGNSRTEPFTPAQYISAAGLTVFYIWQGLELEDFVGHLHVSGPRKSDPMRWDWDHYRKTVRSMLREPKLDLASRLKQPLPGRIKL